MRRQKMMLHMSSGRNGYKLKGESKSEAETPRRTPVTHDATCDGCKSQILGPRYKCTCCVNFDFCEKCMDKYDQEREDIQTGRNYLQRDLISKHPQENHVFCRLSRPVNRNSPPHLQNRSQWVHEGVKCCNCPSTSKDIIGYRYFCTNCAVSVCEACEMNGAHRLDHSLIKMVPPHIANDPLWQECGHH